MLNGYPFVHPAEVRFRDLDGMGHVNNVVYLTYMESARMYWWLAVSGRGELGSVDMILARSEIDYRAPVAFGVHLLVGVRCVSMRRSSFVLEFRVEEEPGGRLVAEARKVLVHYDYSAGRAMPLTADLRRRIKALHPDVQDEADG